MKNHPNYVEALKGYNIFDYEFIKDGGSDDTTMEELKKENNYYAVLDAIKDEAVDVIYGDEIELIDTHYKHIKCINVDGHPAAVLMKYPIEFDWSH